MDGAQARDEVGGVFGGVEGEGAGDDEQGLGEFADGELFAGALLGGLVLVGWERGRGGDFEEGGWRGKVVWIYGGLGKGKGGWKKRDVRL